MNKTGKGGFGDHPELINKKGTKVRDFSSFREAAVELANEEVATKGGKKIPAYKVILRQWMTSPNPKLQIAFIEAAFGKVPDNVNMNLSGQVDIIEIIRDVIDTSIPDDQE